MNTQELIEQARRLAATRWSASEEINKTLLELAAALEIAQQRPEGLGALNAEYAAADGKPWPPADDEFVAVRCSAVSKGRVYTAAADVERTDEDDDPAGRW